MEFDFLGKDSVRYWNFVPVEKKVSEINFSLSLALEGASFAAFASPILFPESALSLCSGTATGTAGQR